MRMRLADRQTKWNEVPGMPLTFQQGGIAMQRVKHPPIRNKIDMTDPAQVRAWTKRLRIGAGDLKALVERTAFVLAGRREHQLLCRFAEGGGEGPCRTLFSSFRLG